MLTADQFHAAVNLYELNPDLGPDVLNLERHVHRGLVGCAELASRLSRGALKGRRLASLFLALAPDVRAVHGKVRALQTRLYKARKLAASNESLAALPVGETSATFALCRVAKRIVDAVDEAAYHFAEAAWVEKAGEEWEGNQEDFDDLDGEPNGTVGRGETRGTEFTVDLASIDEHLDIPAALASSALAAHLRGLFTSGFTFPDPRPLLHAMRMELIELDAPAGPAAPKATVAPPPDEPSGPPEQTDAATRVIALMMEWEKGGRKYTVGQLAKAAGVNRTTLYRNERFKAAHKTMRNMRAGPPHGGRNDAGDLEAYTDEE